MKTENLIQMGMMGVLAYFVYKSLNVAKDTAKEVLDATYKSGQDVGETLGNIYAETFVYPKFQADTQTKYINQGYDYIGEYNFTNYLSLADTYTKQGYDVIGQAIHAGSIPINQDTQMVFIKKISGGGGSSGAF